MKLVLEEISKRYEATVALQPTSLSIREGEFFTILGPSGSGKSTLLRIIGGFLRQSGGRLILDGKDISDTPAFARPVNTVFQDYALFPHMTVFDNVGFSLKVRKAGRAVISEAVERLLDIMDLRGMAARYPAALSGGQRQRVALARALAGDPSLLLLDEPLSALDAGMRKQMQSFLKSLHRRLGTTFVLVTHDQEEAMSLADRVAIMRNGQVEQIGSPEDLYRRPSSSFVAGFLGDNNLIPAVLRSDGGIDTPLGRVTVGAAGVPETGKRLLAIRPENISFPSTSGEPVNCFTGEIAESIFIGPTAHLAVIPENAPDMRISVQLPLAQDGRAPAQGEKRRFAFEPDAAILLPVDEAR